MLIGMSIDERFEISSEKEKKESLKNFFFFSMGEIFEIDEFQNFGEVISK